MKRMTGSPQNKMNWRKVKGMGSIGALGFLMLFQYQNCAPSMQAAEMAKLSSEDNSIVTTIDDTNGATAVSFPHEKVQLATNDQPTVLEGSCDVRQDGAILGWKVRDGEDNELERGYSVCEQGKFEVEMAPSTALECDKSYHVTARLGAGTSGHVELERHCGYTSL